MLFRFTEDLKKELKERGVECFYGNGVNVSDDLLLEPPCSIKWMQIENRVSMGAFSYAVSGYFCGVSIGRYTSIGEAVQIGRSNHAITWVSTSPFFYIKQAIFDVGSNFDKFAQYNGYRAPDAQAQATTFKPITIGNDVWIGHGAFILPGVTVGDGAIIGAMSVVTKNVPPYGIVAGNPATLKRMRLPPVIVARLLQTEWWNYAPWQLKSVDFTNPDLAVHQLESVILNEEKYAPEKFQLKNLIIRNG